MTHIDAKGMEAAQLSEQQLNSLINAEKEINNGGNQEVYLLAVTRHPGK